MSPDAVSNLKLEIGHVLFIDIIGYSKMLITEQSELVRKLTGLVRETEQFHLAEAEGKLVRLPTGDGMALVFRNSAEAPMLCALELSEQLKVHPEVRVRMGVHSGPVNEVADVNERANIAGAGINMAQRVMDCGDAGHILLSKRVADDLEQYPQWRAHLHDLGEVEVKHGVLMSVVNFYTDGVGNPELPQKLRLAKEQAARGATVLRRRKLKWFAAALLTVLALAATAYLYSRFTISKLQSALPVSEKSIAVLPFLNLSDLKDNAFFADGVQDEILTNLARIADLKVISRSSVMQYAAGATRNLRQIAAELGVAHILEGNVQRSGDHIRVNAQLIDARNDAHLWAQVYDRNVTDLFALQSEIAHTIAAQLQAKLSPKEKMAIDQPPTANLAAFALYVEARNLEKVPGNPREALAKQEALLNDALKLDANFVLAHCALAGVHDALYFNRLDPTPERRARGDAEVETATRLAPDMGEVHLARGRHFYLSYRQYRWARAEFELAQKALPNDPQVYTYLGYLNRREGHWEEATQSLAQASALDPADMVRRFELGNMYMIQLRFAEARRTFNTVPTSGAWAQDLRENLADVDFNETADFSGLRAVTPEKDEDGTVPVFNVELAVYARDADRAEQALAGVDPKGFDPSQPRGYWRGAIAR